MTDLATIRVLWRQPDTLALYGIPYDMRPGQSPRDLLRHDKFGPGVPDVPGDWIWLGCPGWWGSLDRNERKEVERFLCTYMDDIPENPYEWTRLPIPPG